MQLEHHVDEAVRILLMAAFILNKAVWGEETAFRFDDFFSPKGSKEHLYFFRQLLSKPKSMP